jgi:hypothetical protein
VVIIAIFRDHRVKAKRAIMLFRFKSSKSAHVFAAVVVATIACRAASADDAAIEKAVLTDFSGGFEWEGSSQVQHVAMRFVAFTRLDEHRIDVRGCGRYNTAGQVTDIRVKMIVDEQTRHVEIWEADPIGSTSFETDGSHKGSLDSDLKGIKAVWTSASGATGKLLLRAGGNLTCSPQVASAR